MWIVTDSREQTPFTFSGPRYEGTTTSIGTLRAGDYSLTGLESYVSVERKSLPDLVLCLGRERARFVREMQLAAAYDAFAVVIEATYGDLAAHKYSGQLSAHSACQSIAAFQVRYPVQFMFAGSHAGAEYACWSFLKQYLETAQKRLKAIVKAHAATVDAGCITI